MQRKQLSFAAVIVSLLVCAAAGASSTWASPPRQYVLRHPKREHCKPHYVRKVGTVRKRIRGKIRKVRRRVCVYVPPVPSKSVPSTPTPPAPVPPPPAPAPPAEPKPIVTATDLEVPPASKEACSVKSFVGGNSILCVYLVKLSVSSAEGQAL